jgi:uncharacterized protein YbcI
MGTDRESSAGAADDAIPSLGAISRELVAVMKQEYGRGPVSAKAYLIDDFLLVVMRGGLTTAERTMLEKGRPDAVREFRQIFENEMSQDLIAVVERLTGRKVVTYQSQIFFDPDIIIEMFFFAEPAGAEALATTARTLTDGV